MIHPLARHWWVLAVRGVLSIVFGIIAFFWPGIFWIVVVYVFAAYALVDGCAAMITAFSHAGSGSRLALFLEGFIGVIAGILAFVWPGITELILLYLIAAWAFLTGIFEIVAATQLRQHARGEWLLALSGVLSIVFGFLLVLWPLPGLIILAWWVAAYAIVFGILLIALAFRLRGAGTSSTRNPSMSESV